MNILWFGRKLECVAKLIFTYFVVCQTLFCVGRVLLASLIWMYKLSYINWPFHRQPRVLANVSWVHFCQKRLIATPHDEVTTDLMLLNMTHNIFPVIFTIILPNMLTLPCPVRAETLVVIYWNLYVILKCYIEKWNDVFQRNKTTWCSVVWHTCKTIVFHGWYM